MISTKNIVSDLRQVPSEWIFEFYANLTEKLVGQDVKILSLFVKEKTPSFCIYYTPLKGYKFKDFSSGKNGDPIQFVVDYFNLANRGEAAAKIMDDYSEYISKNESVLVTPVPESRYQVSDYEIRHWNNLDQEFWMNYQISSKMLSKYNVQPLKFYTLSKLDNNGDYKELKFETQYIYGYFKEDGTLYKIYNPKKKNSKFIKCQQYIQGLEQLNYNNKYLIITSSLKDLMAFQTLGIKNVECIAPDSENSFIPDANMQKFKHKYFKTIVIFDNDEPGIEAMGRYARKYGTQYLVFTLAKDIADSVKEHGITTTRNVLFQLLKNIL